MALGELTLERVADIAREICARKNLEFAGHVSGGAFKRVFRVRTRDSKELALKIICGNISQGRLAREVQALKRCSHPNICRLLEVDTFELNGTPVVFFLEEFLGGGTLSDLLAKGPIEDALFCEIGRILADTLGYLNSLSLVHRDIKPDNIMFRSDLRTPILVDFGLVRDLCASSLTQTWQNQGPGTPYFSAPEQLNNEKNLIDWRTDQFCLGLTLSFARLGLHPYQGPGGPGDHHETVTRVAMRSDRHPDFYRRARKAGLACLEKMTAPWPIGRFRSPLELTAAWQAQERERGK